VVGPTFYGVYSNAKVTSISESVTEYKPSTAAINQDIKVREWSVFPNPGNEFIAVQFVGLNRDKIVLQLMSTNGKLIQQTTVEPGMTTAWFDVRTLYSGTYSIRATSGYWSGSHKVILAK
jgi:hypothetical protein